MPSVKSQCSGLRLVGNVLLGSLACGLLQAQVTTRTDSVGKLLNEWHAAGSAAGLSSITYENRDGGHSRLDAAVWPQLRVHAPAEGDTGPAHLVRPVPLIGNCSMAAPADKGGSLPRLYLLQQQGFDFLTSQYLRNNLFVYPEHQDHDPGWNGRGGWGDLYPANTPCVTISQGSSFTDQPFVRAFLSATAALPPETLSLLIEKRLLAPTLQNLLRRSNRMVKTGDDYLTGRAHPPVFDGTQIDEEKMIMLAHAMTPSMVPPMVVLEVTGENTAVPGVDFFETGAFTDEKLGTSPVAIARVFRSSERRHEMLVTARRSGDLQGRPLKFKWVLLQGDPGLVRIESAGDGVSATISVAWHPELRAASGIQSHRVDIGVFADNGFCWSTPAFITFYMLPNEVRFYDARDRTEEICYEAGNPDPGLPPPTDLRWLALGRRMGADRRHPGVALLSHAMSEVASVRLQGIAGELAPDQESWRKLAADPQRKAEAATALTALQDKLRKRLDQTFDSTGKSLCRAVEDSVMAVAALPDLYLAGQDVMPSLVKESGKPNAWNDFTAARQRLVDYDILKERSPGTFALQVKPTALTAGERHHLRQFHLTVLSVALLPEFLERPESPAYVDERLTTPRTWRDVHRCGKDGSPLGWTRYSGGRTYEFDSGGHLLPDGRNGPAVTVKYVRDEKSRKLVFVPK